MAILRHSQIAVTMNIYSEVSSKETREALHRLMEVTCDNIGAFLNGEPQNVVS